MITIEQLIDVVRDASSLMISDSFEIEQKGGCENIVTSSDMAVQNFLYDKLSTLVPASGFLCEEKEIHDVAHEYTWIIDPIDGTANSRLSQGICGCMFEDHRGNLPSMQRHPSLWSLRTRTVLFGDGTLRIVFRVSAQSLGLRSGLTDRH